jgi:hypothetical protein
MGQLRGLGPPGPLAGALVSPPRPVGRPAAVGGDLPRHRGGRLPQPGGDHGEGLSGMHPRVISSRSASVSRPGPGTQWSWRTSRPGLRRAISATPDGSSPPGARSLVTTGPWPSAAAPAAAALSSDGQASAQPPHRVKESSRLTEELHGPLERAVKRAGSPVDPHIATMTEPRHVPACLIGRHDQSPAATMVAG